MGVRARIKATVDISLGLVVALWVAALATACADIMEIVMNNTSAVMARVWCGAAFLRSPGWVKLQPKREMQLLLRVVPLSARGFDSSPPHLPLSVSTGRNAARRDAPNGRIDTRSDR